MDDQKSIILAHLIKSKAGVCPDFEAVTFVEVDKEGPFKDEKRTYRNLWENGQRIANALLEQGQKKGESFGILMHNHPEFVDLMVGSSIAGTVFVPIDPRTKGEKLAYMLDFSECRGVVVADYAWENLQKILPKLPHLRWIWILGAKPKNHGDKKLTLMADVLSGPAPDLDIQSNDPNETMQLLFTSGTTGDPKAISSAHSRMGVAKMLPSIFGLTRQDIPYTGLSLTHANAQLVTLCMCLYSEMHCVISRKFTKSRLWDITRTYGCTVFNLLGGMTTAIYSEPPKGNDRDNPVRLVISAGMPKVIWAKFEQRYDLKIFEFYGAAEGGLTFNAPGVGPIGSVGKPPPTLIVRTIDENGNICEPCQPGEIVFKNADGSTPVVNYLKNPAATQKKLKDGWLHMGDVGYLNEDGWLFYLYRSGGGLRRNGDFIDPAHIEKEISEHPDVDDVFIYGITLEKNTPGEKEIVAAIVPKNISSFKAQSVFERCTENLEGKYVPQFIQIVDQIPKTASEKPIERFLLDAFDESASNVINNQNLKGK